MFFAVVQLVTCLTLTFLAVAVDVPNLKSVILFKFIPFLVGLVNGIIAFDFFSRHYGWLAA